MTALQDTLRRLDACQEARVWVGDRDLATAWRECARGDWMLWLAARAGVDRRLVVEAACDCAEAALVHVPAGENRPRVAIETARRWSRGEATVEEVRRAAADAADAYAASYAAADADAGRRASLARSADMVRARIPYETIAAALEAT